MSKWPVRAKTQHLVHQERCKPSGQDAAFITIRWPAATRKCFASAKIRTSSPSRSWTPGAGTACTSAGNGASGASRSRHTVSRLAPQSRPATATISRPTWRPGETFEVPPGFIGAYQGDLDDAANSLHKYLFNHSMPAVLRNDPSVSQGGMERLRRDRPGQGAGSPTETKYYPLIDDIAPLGFEDVVHRHQLVERRHHA